MSGYGFVVGLSVVVVTFLVVLLRSRRIREKYAGVWILLGIGVIVVCVWPNLAVSLATLVGVETPSNLVFAVSLVILLAVCIQLSVALSAQEEQTRTLAEEIALIRVSLDREVRGPAGPEADRAGSAVPLDGTVAVDEAPPGESPRPRGADRTTESTAPDVDAAGPAGQR